jgi:hypothetical protein
MYRIQTYLKHMKDDDFDSTGGFDINGWLKDVQCVQSRSRGADIYFPDQPYTATCFPSQRPGSNCGCRTLILTLCETI